MNGWCSILPVNKEDDAMSSRDLKIYISQLICWYLLFGFDQTFYESVEQEVHPGSCGVFHPVLLVILYFPGEHTNSRQSIEIHLSTI